MHRTRFGRTELEVSRIGFGALQIATKYDYAHAQGLLNAALDAGINLIDTARGYQDSEERIGKAISHRRDEFVIATKSGGGTRKDFWQSLHESLAGIAQLGATVFLVLELLAARRERRSG